MTEMKKELNNKSWWWWWWGRIILEIRVYEAGEGLLSRPHSILREKGEADVRRKRREGWGWPNTGIVFAKEFQIGHPPTLSQNWANHFAPTVSPILYSVSPPCWLAKKENERQEGGGRRKIDLWRGGGELYKLEEE